ncbi:MAG: hypothetical protein WB562_20740 [Candidatus Sulfotelmatobacter sp.]
MRQAVVRLARTTYAGFNDHHLREKLCEIEGFSLSRETLRRLLRQAGLGSPRKRRAPAHRQRRLRSAREGELVQLDGSPHDWLEGRGPHLTALGLQDDATGKILAAQFFPSETAFGYLSLLRQLLRRYGVDQVDPVPEFDFLAVVNYGKTDRAGHGNATLSKFMGQASLICAFQ